MLWQQIKQQCQGESIDHLELWTLRAHSRYNRVIDPAQVDRAQVLGAFVALGLATQLLVKDELPARTMAPNQLCRATNWIDSHRILRCACGHYSTDNQI